LQKYVWGIVQAPSLKIFQTDQANICQELHGVLRTENWTRYHLKVSRLQVTFLLYHLTHAYESAKSILKIVAVTRISASKCYYLLVARYSSTCQCT